MKTARMAVYLPFGPFCQAERNRVWKHNGKEILIRLAVLLFLLVVCVSRDDGSRSRKVWNLLSYLILNRERDLGVAELYQLLWQDKDEENPYGALKTLVFRVRRLLEEAGFPATARVLSSKGIYRWNPQLSMKVDGEEFEHLSKLCLAEAFDMETEKEQWKTALSLYKGEFLPGAGDAVWMKEKESFTVAFIKGWCVKSVSMAS